MSLLRLHRGVARVVIACLSTVLGYGCSSNDAEPKPAAVSRPSTDNSPSEPAKTPAAAETQTEGEEPDPLDRVFQKLYDKVAFDGLAVLTEDEQVVYLVLRLRYEVLQGGLEYFFFNLAGVHARESVTALEKIGMADAAAVLDRACDLFPDQRPAELVDDRQIQLDDFTDDQRRQLETLGALLTQSLETAGEKVEYYLKTHAVTPAQTNDDATDEAATSGNALPSDAIE